MCIRVSHIVQAYPGWGNTQGINVAVCALRPALLPHKRIGPKGDLKSAFHGRSCHKFDASVTLAFSSRQTTHATYCSDNWMQFDLPA